MTTYDKILQAHAKYDDTIKNIDPIISDYVLKFSIFRFDVRVGLEVTSPYYDSITWDSKDKEFYIIGCEGGLKLKDATQGLKLMAMKSIPILEEEYLRMLEIDIKEFPGQ